MRGKGMKEASQVGHHERHAGMQYILQMATARAGVQTRMERAGFLGEAIDVRENGQTSFYIQKDYISKD